MMEPLAIILGGGDLQYSENWHNVGIKVKDGNSGK